MRTRLRACPMRLGPLLTLLSFLAQDAIASSSWIGSRRSRLLDELMLKYQGRELLQNVCPAGSYLTLSPSPPPAPFPPLSPISNLCLPCSAGTSSVSGSDSELDCDACAAGTTSVTGGLCLQIITPAINLAIQRDILILFLGPSFDTFQLETQVYRERFNNTIVAKADAGSLSNLIWLYRWKSGSIVTELRLTYPDGTTTAEMNSDAQNLVTNAASIFSNLSEFGINTVRGDFTPSEDVSGGSSKTLAIALGIGLGVGMLVIGVIAALIIFRKKKPVVQPSGYGKTSSTYAGQANGPDPSPNGPVLLPNGCRQGWPP
eukprot:gene31034-7126_t